MRLHGEKGFPLEVFAISSRGGIWEPEWDVLRTTALGKLVSYIPRSVIEDAKRGDGMPLKQALGLPPEGSLRKLPIRTCALIRTCTLVDPKKCRSTSDDKPICFEPDIGQELEEVRELSREIVRLWTERVYVLIVEEEA